MQNDDHLLVQRSYPERLEAFEGIHFTHREVDVLACLLKRQTTKKIAALLSIEPNTVLVHTRNIKGKVGCSFRDEIVKFIENSEKLAFIEDHYTHLIILAAFEKGLKLVSKLKKSETQAYFLIDTHDQTQKITLMYDLQAHLQKAGLEVEVKEEGLTQILLLLAVVNKSQNPSQKNTDLETIDLRNEHNYYFSVISILKKLFPTSNIEEIFFEFNNIYKNSTQSPQEEKKEPTPHLVNTEENSFIHLFTQIERNSRKQLAYWVASLLLICFMGLGYLHLQLQDKHISQTSLIRSNILLPSKSVLLSRPELIAQMDTKLKQQTGIQTLALVGMGGAGKTTLAHQYAHAQRSPITWQIKAETLESLKSSFEDLAHALAQRDEDKRRLSSFQEIKNLGEREQKILFFIQEQMKAQPHWILIFDNVEAFDHVLPYFPNDPAVWGRGKIILTTRNINLQNSKYIPHVLHLGELNQDQKLALFSNVMSHGDPLSFTKDQKEKAKIFLTKIPPFPLDIVIAGNYIKATRVSYDKYLLYLSQGKSGFHNVQKNVLKEIGDYEKTRHHIISLSFKQLIDTHKDFGHLLLFVSLLDSRHIPRDLLEAYKEDVIVDDFIYHLKKYSLVTDEDTSSFGHTLAMHRSTQGIGLTYLTKALDLKNNYKLLSSISTTLKNYMADAIDKEDVTRMKLLINHSEWFLKHPDLLARREKASLGGELGGLYFYVNNYSKAKQILEESLQSGKQDSQSLPVFVYLGLVYLDLADYDKAKFLLEKSLQLYKQTHPTNYTRQAQILGYLGSVAGALGHYEKSKSLFEQSLKLYNSHDPGLSLRKASVLISLGNLYRELGDYGKAKDFLEQALSIFKNQYPATHIRNAWALAILGNVYRGLGDYHKAKDTLEKSLTVYKKNYPENHISVAWVSTYLGSTYRKLGQYENAKQILEQSYQTHKNILGDNNVNTAWVLIHLGNTYKDLGDAKKAQEVLEKGYHVYVTNKVGTAWAESNLGNFYQTQGQIEKAKDLLEKTLLKYQKHLSKDNIRTGFVLRCLGKVYRGLGNTPKARSFLEQSQPIYEKVYGRNHIETGRLYQDLSHVSIDEGYLDAAENLLHKVLSIFQLSKHPDIYSVLEDLATLELKKAKEAVDKGNREKAQAHNTQAKNYLNQVLVIVKSNFPKDSPHIRRVQDKLQEIQQRQGKH